MRGQSRASGLPLKLFDSSTGFRLPDGSVLSPDASVVRLERWQALTPEQRRLFLPTTSHHLWSLAESHAARVWSIGVLPGNTRRVAILRAVGSASIFIGPASPHAARSAPRLDWAPA